MNRRAKTITMMDLEIKKEMKGGDKMSQVRVLYTGADKDSKKAKVLLKKAHIEFQEIFIHDPAREEKIVPQLLTFEGFFPTIELIGWYARVYGSGANSKKSHLIKRPG